MDQHRVRVRNNHVGLGYGDSAIFSPDGRPMAEADLFREALIHADAHIRVDETTGHPSRPHRIARRDRVPMQVRDQLAAAMREHPAKEWSTAPRQTR
jgi:predicted amidohydrolase